MNGELAVELAREEGLVVEPLIMYDDIASAPRGREPDRRGAPGTTFVYKIVGARAEEEAPLEELLQLGQAVRDATRTLSVAVNPPISPLTGQPMFSLPPDEIFIGMGVHGEPGFARLKVGPVAQVVQTMVQGLLEDLPFQRGAGRIFYFRPGHESYAVYRQIHCLKVIDNAVRWASPTAAAAASEK